MVESAVEKMRREGRAYLRKKPGAFGGGIDPSTGIRRRGGRRVSVGTPEEIKAGVEVPTLAEARAISRQPLAPTELRLLKAGGIKVGGVTYHGGAVVPFSGGKTANQIRRRVFKQARGEGITKMGTFSARIPIEEKHRPRIPTRRIIRQPPKKLVPIRQPKKELRPTLLPKISLKKAKAGTVEFMDVVSGGYFTERRINKRQEKINQDVDEFNKKYGGKELTESQYKQALKVSKDLGTRETQVIKDRDKLASSMRSKAGHFIFGEGPGHQRLTSKELAERIEKGKPKIKEIEKEIKEYEEKIAKASKKKDPLSKLNLKRLKAIKGSKEISIARLKTGEATPIIMGEFPIIPAVQIPAGVTAIKFVGTQKKVKGGKIITDIVFQTSRGQIGVAKGVSVAKGKHGASVVLGRTGKRVFKLPSGKAKIIQLETFIGREKTLTMPSKIALQKNINILNKAKETGVVVKIKKNLDIMKQAGIGQIASVKGKKLMKGGKAVRGITRDNFASISAIFTKKDLSLIVGKSITQVGAKSKFIGIIKGTSKAGKGAFTVGGKGGISALQKKQYEKALQKVISATAGALTKSQKTGKLPRATVLALASKLAVAGAKPSPKITPKMKPKTKVTTKPVIKPKTKPKTIITGAVTTTRPRTKKKPVVKLKPVTPKKPKKAKRVRVKHVGRIKPKVTRVSPAGRKIREQQIKAKQKITTKQKSKQKAKQIARAKSLAKTKSKARAKTLQAKAKALSKKKPVKAKAKAKGVKAPQVPRLPRVAKGKKRKVARGKIRPTPKKKQAYNVYARPLKKKGAKRRPKLVKVNKVPLRKKRAKDVRNYVTDTSLSRTGRIKKTKGKPKTSRLKVPRGYAKKTSKKFRRHQRVKGKRKLLPKGKVIERSKRLLDTKGEKNQIGLRKRIRQITKPRKVKRTTRKPVNNRARQTQSRPKVTGAKRTQMLDNLAKARKVRASNLKKKKR